MKTNTDLALSPAKRGRPEMYSDALAEAVCERIATGERLRAICADDDMPSIPTVSKWLMRRPEFNLAYARAREAQQHLENERALEIADDPSIPPEHKRIMVDTRKWTAERLNRKSYGNSVKHEHEVTLHAPATAERIPTSLNWIAGQLPGREPPGGSESGSGGLGEE